MHPKPTLVILSPGFPKDEADTTCLPPKQLFVRLLKEQFPHLDIIVIAFQYPFQKSVYQWNGVQVISLAGQNKRKFSKLILWTKAWRQLNRLRKQKNIVGILSFWCSEAALVGSWFGNRHNIQHRCWVSGQDAKKENKLVKWIRPSGYELVAMSDFLSESFFKNHGIKPSYVVPIGIDRNLFNARPIEKDIDVMGAGSLIPLKQYDVFLQVVNQLKKHQPEIKAVICGKGNEEKKLKELIQQLDLSENVILTGEKEHKEVLQFMQRSKLFIHPSSYEGFGSVCIEALYAGAEVISFCQPMKTPIPNWHIVNNKEEMSKQANSILQTSAPSNKPILAFSMEDSVKAMMNLFNYKD